jgi:transposase
MHRRLAQLRCRTLQRAQPDRAPLFNKLKHFRRIATRYDKLARNYKSFLLLVAALKWLV